MWIRVVLLTLAAAASAYEQGCLDVELRKPRKISLVVVDPKGSPVTGASVAYLADPMKPEPSTDSTGAFGVTTTLPASVIRKLGYENRFVRINATSDLG